VHAKQEGKECAGIDKATADLFPNSFVESELGSIPKGWEVNSLGDKVIPKRGKIITKLTTSAGDIPVVAGGLDPAYFHNKSNVVSPAITISSSGANAGFVRLYQQDIWASDCCYISSEQTQEVFFWYIFLKANQEKIYFMQQGAAQPHIYASDLMRLTVCLPKDYRLVAAFNTLVTPLFNSIKIANNQIHTLSNLRDTLLPRLISGKLDLSNIEVQLEEVA
jgi:type I restriction enzyme S subunit